MNLNVTLIQDEAAALQIMKEVATWMENSGKYPSLGWQAENFTDEIMAAYVNSDEYYVLLVNGIPAAAAVFQLDQRNQSWRTIDKNQSPPALYIHWLCVSRQFAGQGLSQHFMNFAQTVALEKNLTVLRLDTDGSKAAMKKLYEGLGFTLVGMQQALSRVTAFYEKTVIMDHA